MGVGEFLQTPKGKAVTTVLLVLGIAAIAYSVFFSSDAAVTRDANARYFIDAKTGKAFSYTLKVGEKIPIDTPSGKTGYPAEACYWTKDGKIKSEPTWVLLNNYAGKTGPTFCPDCGRRVTAHNPPPDPAMSPPPTEAEVAQRRDRNAPAEQTR